MTRILMYWGSTLRLIPHVKGENGKQSKYHMTCANEKAINTINK